MKFHMQTEAALFLPTDNSPPKLTAPADARSVRDNCHSCLWNADWRLR